MRPPAAAGERPPRAAPVECPSGSGALLAAALAAAAPGALAQRTRPCTVKRDCGGTKRASAANGTAATGCTCTCLDQWTGSECKTCPGPLYRSFSGWCRDCHNRRINYPTCNLCTAADVTGGCDSARGTPEANKARNGCWCRCKNGFTGATCDSCSTGWIGYPACTQCTSNTHCNGRATAVTSDPTQTACECTCRNQYDPASDCSTCLVPYNTSDPSDDCGACSDDYIALGNGTGGMLCIHCDGRQDLTPTHTCNSLMDSVWSDDGTQCYCDCKHGFQGDACEECANNWINWPNCRQCSSAVDCNNHARKVWHNATKTGCQCTQCDNQWTGTKCETCPPEFEDNGDKCNKCVAGRIGYPTCELCNVTVHCSGNAVSVSDDGTRDYCLCTCKTSFDPLLDCAECEAGYIAYPTCAECTTAAHCSGHASAVTSDKSRQNCVCTCDTGYDSPACNTCAPGYAGYPSCTLTTAPTTVPSPSPSQTPSATPSTAPITPIPSASPTSAAPSAVPTSASPSANPSVSPTAAPSAAPTVSPTFSPSASPTQNPSAAPTASPVLPTQGPSPAPSQNPSAAPTAPPVNPSAAPSTAPSQHPTAAPSLSPTQNPTTTPTAAPSAAAPSVAPTSAPSAAPTQGPSTPPTTAPTQAPSTDPTTAPTSEPTTAPTWAPSTAPSVAPSAGPSRPPTQAPSTAPTGAPTLAPSWAPTVAPSTRPSTAPTAQPSAPPSAAPSSGPSATPSAAPSAAPTSNSPSTGPSEAPTARPSQAPTKQPSPTPSAAPSRAPRTPEPSRGPSAGPSSPPSAPPSAPAPTRRPSTSPSLAPSPQPSAPPTPAPSGAPSAQPSAPPQQAPTAGPSAAPSRSQCPEGQVGFPECRKCTIADDCNGYAYKVVTTGSGSGAVCQCHCLQRHHRGYTASGLNATAENHLPVYAGDKCERCASGFAGWPACNGCTARANCSNGAVSAALLPDGSGCSCTCHDSYSGPRCDECAEGKQRDATGLCVGRRFLTIAPKAVAGSAVAGGSVEVVIKVTGDHFTKDAAASFGLAATSLTQLTSDQSPDADGMAHAFEGSVAVQQQNSSVTFLSVHLRCDDGGTSCGTATALVITLGPLASFSLARKEVITVRFRPSAFSSSEAGWNWEGPTVSFNIQKHVRDIAGVAIAAAVLEETAGTAAFTAAAPGGAGKLNLVAKLAECPKGKDEEVEPLGFTESPLGAALGPADLGQAQRQYIGAAVLNTLVVIPGMFLLHALSACLVWNMRAKVCGNKRASLRGSMSWVLFPAWQIIPFMLFYQGTLEAAFHVIYYGELMWQLLLCPIALILSLTVPLGLHRATSGSFFQARLVPYERQNTPVRRFLFGNTTWASCSDKTWVNRYGMIFWDFAPNAVNFIAFECGAVVCLSLIGAYEPVDRPTCILKAASVCFIFVIQVCFALYMRPFLAAYDAITYMINNVFQGLGAFAALVMIARGDDADTTTEERLATAATLGAVFSLLGKTLGDFTLFVFEGYEDCKQKVKDREQDGPEKPGDGQGLDSTGIDRELTQLRPRDDSVNGSPVTPGSPASHALRIGSMHSANPSFRSSGGAQLLKADPPRRRRGRSSGLGDIGDGADSTRFGPPPSPRKGRAQPSRDRDGAQSQERRLSPISPRGKRASSQAQAPRVESSRDLCESEDDHLAVTSLMPRSPRSKRRGRVSPENSPAGDAVRSRKRGGGGGGSVQAAGSGSGGALVRGTC